MLYRYGIFAIKGEIDFGDQEINRYRHGGFALRAPRTIYNYM